MNGQTPRNIVHPHIPNTSSCHLNAHQTGSRHFTDWIMSPRQQFMSIEMKSCRIYSNRINMVCGLITMGRFRGDLIKDRRAQNHRHWEEGKGSEDCFKSKLLFFRILRSYNKFFFRGDLNDISAKTATLGKAHGYEIWVQFIVRWVVTSASFFKIK